MTEGPERYFARLLPISMRSVLPPTRTKVRAARDGFVKVAGFLLLVAFLLSSSFLFAQNASAIGRKHFLWRAESGTATVYLLGSIHFMKKESYPLDQSIEGAFAKANVLAVEADITDSSKVDVEKLIDRAFYPDDDSLEGHISPETFEMIKKDFADMDIIPGLIERQRPWFLALTLTSVELLKMGLDPDYGIDRHFILEASGKKKIVELESADYQIDLLTGFSDREQELFLVYALKDIAMLKEDIESIMMAWQTGDAKALESLLSKGSMGEKSMADFYEKLLYERNRNMTSRIQEFLNSKDTYFVVVGAGHLIGERGIIETLRRKGYSIEQL